MEILQIQLMGEGSLCRRTFRNN